MYQISNFICIFLDFEDIAGFSDTSRHGQPSGGGGGGGFSSGGFQGLDEVLRKEKEKWASLPPVQKSFYREHPEVTAMFDDEVETLMLVTVLR